MTPNQLSSHINMEVTPEQWSSSLTAISWWFWEVLDGIGTSSPNLTYTCVVGTAPRLEYITWRDVLKEGDNLIYWTKPYDTYYLDHPENRFSNLNYVLQFKTIKSNRFSSGIDLALPSTLYKFIVWAAWVWVQSCFGTNSISVLTPLFSPKDLKTCYLFTIFFFFYFMWNIFIYIRKCRVKGPNCILGFGREHSNPRTNEWCWMGQA